MQRPLPDTGKMSMKACPLRLSHSALRGPSKQQQLAAAVGYSCARLAPGADLSRLAAKGIDQGATSVHPSSDASVEMQGQPQD